MVLTFNVHLAVFHSYNGWANSWWKSKLRKCLRRNLARVLLPPLGNIVLGYDDTCDFEVSIQDLFKRRNGFSQKTATVIVGVSIKGWKSREKAVSLEEKWSTSWEIFEQKGTRLSWIGRWRWGVPVYTSLSLAWVSLELPLKYRKRCCPYWNNVFHSLTLDSHASANRSANRSLIVFMSLV